MLDDKDWTQQVPMVVALIEAGFADHLMFSSDASSGKNNGGDESVRRSPCGLLGHVYCHVAPLTETERAQRFDAICVGCARSQSADDDLAQIR